MFLRLKTQRIKDETTVTCKTHQFLSNNAEKPMIEIYKAKQ